MTRPRSSETGTFQPYNPYLAQCFMQSWDLVHVICMTEGGMDGRLQQAQEDKHFKLHNGPLGPGS